MPNLLKFKLLLPFLLLPLLGFGQFKNTGQYWLAYQHKYILKEKLSLDSDAGFRGQSQLTEDYYYRIHVRPGIKFQQSFRMSFYAGLGLFYQYNNISINTFEIRPWQGFKFMFPVYRRFRFHHYARLEQRILTSKNASQYTAKLRYQFSTKIPLNKFSIQNNTYFLPASVEVFLNPSFANKEVRQDRLRITVGIGYRQNRQNQFELTYVFQNAKNNVTDIENQADHIIQFSFIHSINF